MTRDRFVLIGSGISIGIGISILLFFVAATFLGCSSPTNPIVYDEESLEDDMEYIDSGKTLSERLKRLREVQEEDLLNKEGEKI